MEAYFAGIPEPKQLIWIESTDHFFSDKLDEFESAMYETSR